MKKCGMKKCVLVFLCISCSHACFCWGFYAHRQINFYAVFLLPPEMLVLYKPEIDYLADHAVDPDKRRYIVKEEGPRHYIDIDKYGVYPYPDLPRSWEDACKRYSEDSLVKHGIAPWWITRMVQRLTRAFETRNRALILKTSADLGHYLADIHVPLHASSNHNGQHTGQHGIHGFWESRIPELFAASTFDFLIGRADYIRDVPGFTWDRVLESAAAADTVLLVERMLSAATPPDRKYAYDMRQGLLVRQYAAGYTAAYHQRLNGMVERRMRQSIYAVASCWYTAWVNAGQPSLRELQPMALPAADSLEWRQLQQAWMRDRMLGRSCAE
jgi:hypothetical protein